MILPFNGMEVQMGEAITLAPNGTGIVDVQGSMNSSLSSTGKSLVMGF